MKEPKQWIYIIQKDNELIKVGVSINPSERIAYLQRMGGFNALKTELFGPVHNGFNVENLIHKKLNSYRVIVEWFKVSYEVAVEIAKNIVKEYGITKALKDDKDCDFDKLMKLFYPNQDYRENIIISNNKHGKTFFETEDCGLFSFDFLNAFATAKRIHEEADYE